MNKIKYHMITFPGGQKYKLSESHIAHYAWMYLHGQHMGTISPYDFFMMSSSYERAKELGIEPSRISNREDRPYNTNDTRVE